MRRHVHKEPVLPDSVLAEGAAAETQWLASVVSGQIREAERWRDTVAWREACHGVADGYYLAGRVRCRDAAGHYAGGVLPMYIATSR